MVVKGIFKFFCWESFVLVFKRVRHTTGHVRTWAIDSNAMVVIMLQDVLRLFVVLQDVL